MLMDESEKLKFVKDVCNGIARGIMDDIESGKIPSEWTGFELRWLVQEHAISNFGREDKRRYKDFKNTVLVNNL